MQLLPGFEAQVCGGAQQVVCLQRICGRQAQLVRQGGRVAGGLVEAGDSGRQTVRMGPMAGSARRIGINSRQGRSLLQQRLKNPVVGLRSLFLAFFDDHLGL